MEGGGRRMKKFRDKSKKIFSIAWQQNVICCEMISQKVKTAVSKMFAKLFNYSLL
jgi:hypothetical protein